MIATPTCFRSYSLHVNLVFLSLINALIVCSCLLFFFFKKKLIQFLYCEFMLLSEDSN